MRHRYPHLRFEALKFTGAPPERGGMCEVREAWWADEQVRDEAGNLRMHHVAVKSLLPEHVANEDLKQRFRLEADLLCNRLDHPCVAVAYSTGEHHGQLYVVMEWADLTLSDVIDSRLAQVRSRCTACAGDAEHRHCPEPRKSPCRLYDETILGPSEIVAILNPVRKALSYTHDMPILHRDIKPGNVLLVRLAHPAPPGLPPGISAHPQDDNKIVMTQRGVATVFKVVLTDFGIARDGRQNREKSSFTMIGTPDYASPEHSCPN